MVQPIIYFVLLITLVFMHVVVQNSNLVQTDFPCNCIGCYIIIAVLAPLNNVIAGIHCVHAHPSNCIRCVGSYK